VTVEPGIKERNTDMRNAFYPICGIVLLAALAVLWRPSAATADENLALYGHKGYAYTFSPRVVKGFYLQTGLNYANYDEPDVNDGSIVSAPISVTWGDGRRWEVAAATHFESWDSDETDDGESGIGDLFLGGKVQLLGGDRPLGFDLSLMPYVTLPTGNRDDWIGDLYNFNPTNEDDPTFGLNLLLGRGWERFYIAANLGINYLDSDLDYVDDTSVFFGLTGEYYLSEVFSAYVEFFNNGNKIDLDCDPCVTQSTNDDYRELGAGVLYLWRKWGFKAHVGTGLSDVSPDVRVLGLVNRNF